MLQSLKNALEQYKAYTLQLIESLEKEDFDVLDKILDNRQDTIEKIDTLQYKQEELFNMVEELKILHFQNKLEVLMNEKRNKIKTEMDKIKKTQTANNVYNKNLYNKGIGFNTKI